MTLASSLVTMVTTWSTGPGYSRWLEINSHFQEIPLDLILKGNKLWSENPMLHTSHTDAGYALDTLSNMSYTACLDTASI